MLASPLLPSPGFSEDASQYRPVKDLEAFNKLLPPPIEFVEGSSSGTLAIAEGKYQPINSSPKSNKVETHELKKAPHSSPAKSTKSLPTTSRAGKALYTGSLETAWPSGTVVGSGLHNTGNTCFLNSALQCLLHTPPLLHILMAHTKSDPCRVTKGSFCMSCGLRQVMMESHGKHHTMTPYPIITKLNVIAKPLRRGRQEDSHEFLRYAVDALQKSCLAGYPPKLDPKLAETTWVHRIFGGRLRSRVTCLSCGHNSDTFDSILDLSVDICGVSSLKEALRKFIAVDHLKGADKYKCEKCKKHVTAEKQFTIHDAPLVLTIHLKRFSPMGRKIGHPIRYDEKLSLQPVMSEGQHGPTYSLYGVISHAGGGPNSGHYYAHVKGANGLWYEMNDDSVTRVQGAPTGMKNAYMLFYMRDKGQALEAAVSAPSRPIPQKAGVVAAMKKRKVIESEDEDDKKATSQSTAPFIGPRLPSPTPATPSQSNSIDPQAELLKKRSPPPLRKVQYNDDDDEDIGEKMEVDKAESAGAPSSSMPDISGSSISAPSIPAPPTPPPPRFKTPPISPSSFYGPPATSKHGSVTTDKKRKSSDMEDDDESMSRWARTRISPEPFSSGSKKERRRPKHGGAHNPFNRLKGGNNLQQRRESTGNSPGMTRYRRKKFLI
ncbi:Ubiquitin carboxyl-terminal hydrolase 42 [Grifola frondosa]|uniref:Ubiquitin carboxyl-terminal hydrolase n=1 Tax=Grifola frondosa TaxID=5627 RepID=A0A1C7MJW0_GRIFR|nr:Ubiquitin carboxyl-terminal hydrolase 42 [Grifola frondosa]